MSDEVVQFGSERRPRRQRDVDPHPDPAVQGTDLYGTMPVGSGLDVGYEGGRTHIGEDGLSSKTSDGFLSVLAGSVVSGVVRVAASDASNESKAQADFICSGDEAEETELLKAAIALAYERGSMVSLSEGVFVGTLVYIEGVPIIGAGPWLTSVSGLIYWGEELGGHYHGDPEDRVVRIQGITFGVISLKSLEGDVLFYDCSVYGDVWVQTSSGVTFSRVQFLGSGVTELDYSQQIVFMDCSWRWVEAGNGHEMLVRIGNSGLVHFNSCLLNGGTQLGLTELVNIGKSSEIVVEVSDAHFIGCALGGHVQCLLRFLGQPDAGGVSGSVIGCHFTGSLPVIRGLPGVVRVLVCTGSDSYLFGVSAWNSVMTTSSDSVAAGWYYIRSLGGLVAQDVGPVYVGDVIEVAFTGRRGAVGSLVSAGVRFSTGEPTNGSTAPSGILSGFTSYDARTCTCRFEVTQDYPVLWVTPGLYCDEASFINAGSADERQTHMLVKVIPRDMEA